MIEKPKTTFVRFSQLVDWLAEHGISIRVVRKCIKSETIKREYFGNTRRAHYRVSQVEAACNLNGHNKDDEKT